MFKLIDKFKSAINGVIHGFDRIVFQGFLMPIMYPEGAMSFLDQKNILYKDAKNWFQHHTDNILSSLESQVIDQCGHSIEYLASSNIRKEAVAHQRQEERGIRSGLIGAWSCVEAGNSFRIAPSEGRPVLRWVQTRCKHIYLYLDHEDYGFMNIRIQSWFPYKIQIALNGREWLSRQLQKSNVDFVRHRNKFLHIDDYDKAQSLLHAQLDTDWCSMLNGFLPLAFPTMVETVGPEMTYTWTCWQSEWASDMIFNDTSGLSAIMESCVKHTLTSGHAGRIYRFFGRPVNKLDQPHHAFSGNIQTRTMDTSEGIRVRHWIDHNSVKLYNEQNVIRIETTINQPSAFKVNRKKQGAPESAPKERLALRKGVADVKLRAHVSQEVNDRFSEHLAATHETIPMKDVLAPVLGRKTIKRRKIRPIDPIGKDREFLAAIADQRFVVNGFSNKDLREVLTTSPRFSQKTEKQISGAITRLIRLMRDHSLIRKLPRQNRYRLTTQGQKITTLVMAALAASTKDLLDHAA
ncbi:MAG: hypothetical protein HQK65_22460 [Desulfamplus sp.]|nr:hypothetical protein [Desulfamplus sp.]